MTTNKKTFKFARKVKLKEFEEGSPIFSADYTFIQENGDDPAIYQCDLIEEPEAKSITFEMKPGIFKIEPSPMGLQATSIETQKVDFLETSKTYEEIIRQIDAFFKNLHVYAKLGIKHPRRGALIHSVPGAGKSSTIARVSELYAKERKACVLVWPSDAVRPDDLEAFLTKNSDWTNVDKLILIIEDIGGGQDIYGSQHTKVPASLLNFLDGINDVFQKPTFIIATTNNPDALLDSLTSRPGRFDAVIEIKTPNAVDRIRFLKFFAKEDYTLNGFEEKEMEKLTDGFSVAHLKEIYFRAMLLEKPLLEAASEIKSHIRKVKEGLTKKPTGSVGFGEFDD
jgi:SpoVK/Ycf46/Vps4 family AAA+-type ATPase